MKSNIKVDTEAVKKELEEVSDWSGTCRVCGKTITGTLQQLRDHKETHGK